MKPILPVILKLGFLTRFFSHIEFGSTADCWEWAGNRDRQGYGMVKARPKTYRAHRVSWVIAHRVEIPTGKDICHSCDNPACVNPAHLFLGTNDDNIRDKVRKGRQSHAGISGPGELNPRAILKATDVLEIRAKYRPFKVTAKMLASEYGISEREIRSIVYRENWSHMKEA